MCCWSKLIGIALSWWAWTRYMCPQDCSNKVKDSSTIFFLLLPNTTFIFSFPTFVVACRNLIAFVIACGLWPTSKYTCLPLHPAGKCLSSKSYIRQGSRLFMPYYIALSVSLFILYSYFNVCRVTREIYLFYYSKCWKAFFYTFLIGAFRVSA